jgi:hypothetical protein
MPRVRSKLPALMEIHDRRVTIHDIWRTNIAHNYVLFHARPGFYTLSARAMRRSNAAFVRREADGTLLSPPARPMFTATPVRARRKEPNNGCSRRNGP